MESSNKSIVTHLQFTTPHYRFNCTVKEETYPLRKLHLLVGNEGKPCVDCIITLQNNSNNTRYDSFTYTAKLNQIDALHECSLDDITDEYMAAHSFGTELLDAMVFFINSQCQSITTVSLDDASYIPCIRDSKDTLDLLVYSIALYGKTWYEQRLNAYITPQSKYEEYRRQVDRYISKETKEKLSFTDIYRYVMHASNFTTSIFNDNKDEFESLFHKSNTLPEFFRAISKRIGRTEKCRFFKYWLERLIKDYVMIERTWYFDLFPKIEVLNQYVLNRTNKNKTRKNKRISTI